MTLVVAEVVRNIKNVVGNKKGLSYSLKPFTNLTIKYINKDFDSAQPDNQYVTLSGVEGS